MDEAVASVERAGSRGPAPGPDTLLPVRPVCPVQVCVGDRPRAGQRGRMVRAVGDVVAIAGFHDATVVDLCDLAGASTRTFYNHFPDLAAALVEAYLDVDDEIRGVIERAWAGDGGGGRVMRCVSALVDFVRADPRAAAIWFVEGFAAGPPVLEARGATIRWVSTRVSEEVRGGAEARRELRATLAVGGVVDVIRGHVFAGRVGQLPHQIPGLAAAVEAMVGGAIGAPPGHDVRL